MTPEGRIMIDLFLRRNGGEVKIASSRPLSITRQFAGRRPDEVIRAVSLLFWTCKSAQSIAAVEAFEAALKRPVPEKVKKVRALLILAEIAREHALRIVIDWPKFLSVPEEAPPAAHVRAIMKIGQDFDRLLHQETNGEKALATAVGELRSFLEQAIFAEDLERWCERITQDALTEWAALKTTGAQRLVHQLAEGRRIAVCAVELRALPSLAPQELAVRLFSKESRNSSLSRIGRESPAKPLRWRGMRITSWSNPLRRRMVMASALALPRRSSNSRQFLLACLPWPTGGTLQSCRTANRALVSRKSRRRAGVSFTP